MNSGKTMLFRLLVNTGLILAAGAATAAPDVTFEQLVEAHRTVDRVRWAHREWPAANDPARPTFETVQDDDRLRTRVADLYRRSSALERRWGRRISSRDLQRELDRMARSTSRPELLQEMFDALDNDPRLIAEAIARPNVVESMIRSAYATDRAMHGPVRSRLEGALGDGRRVSLESVADTYRVERWTRDDPSSSERDTWPRRIGALGRRFGVDAGDPTDLPRGVVAPVTESPTGYSTFVILDATAESITLGRAAWTKRTFASWWRENRRSFPIEIDTSSASYVLPWISGHTCAPGTWSDLSPDLPGPRAGHTAVWTGTEMLVWGSEYRDHGGSRYDPATDTWAAIPQVPASPSAREGHTAIWTGSEMIVWGGTYYDDPKSDGAIYDPVLDAWRPMTPAPTARGGHTAIWTGDRMIVWGGRNDDGDTVGQDGYSYDPASDTWTPISTVGQPSRRHDHTAIWTGSEMIVWGGAEVGEFISPKRDGARYDPVADQWAPVAAGPNAPAARYGHSAVWADGEMIVWAGLITGAQPRGARYDPSTDSWATVSESGADSGVRRYHEAVWTGSEMFVWGGDDYGGLNLLPGLRYDPSTDSWTTTSTIGSPLGKLRASVVKADDRVIVWGGGTSTGGLYDPADDTWSPTLSTPRVPNYEDGGVWTGNELLVWGASDESFDPFGIRVDPATNHWASLPLPSGFDSESLTVWTGSRVLAWSTASDSGFSFDPITGVWTPMSTSGAPNMSFGMPPVWTGSELIVWGSAPGPGGRYDPAADSWTPMASGPAHRSFHSAVWTGSEMIIWGGRADDATNARLDSGSRYDPVQDTWSAISVDPATPSPRSQHAAEWTGDRMIVWGGSPGPSNSGVADGASYDPVGDSWSPIATGPTPRRNVGSIWTGRELIVGSGFGATGRPWGDRYDPAADTYREMTRGNELERTRGGISLVEWDGSHVVTFSLGNGRRYCVPPCDSDPPTDADGDQVCDGVDLCPGAADPTQTETDGDGAGDACDCAPSDPTVRTPPEVGGVEASRPVGDTLRLSWAPVVAADRYAVTRGPLATLPASDFGTCLDSTVIDTSFDDGDVPSSGAGYGYLVGATSTACGPGPLGTSSVGAPRINTNPSACP